MTESIEVVVLSLSPSIPDASGVKTENALQLGYLLANPTGMSSASCTRADFTSAVDQGLLAAAVEADWDAIVKASGRKRLDGSIALLGSPSTVDAWVVRDWAGRLAEIKGDVDLARRARDDVVAALGVALRASEGRSANDARGNRLKWRTRLLELHAQMARDVLTSWMKVEDESGDGADAVAQFVREMAHEIVVADHPIGAGLLRRVNKPAGSESGTDDDQFLFAAVFGLSPGRALELIAGPRRAHTTGADAVHDIPGNLRPTSPANVWAYQAHDDMVGAVAMAYTAGRLGFDAALMPVERPFFHLGRSQLAAFSGLGLGLGYCGYTHDVARLTDFFKVGIEVGSDCILIRPAGDTEWVNAIDYLRVDNPGLEDIAIILRVPVTHGDDGFAHVLVAGHTANATELAGRWISRHWRELADRYDAAGRVLAQDQAAFFLDVGTSRVARDIPLPQRIRLIDAATIWARA